MQIKPSHFPVRDIHAYWNKFKPLQADISTAVDHWIAQAATLEKLWAPHNTVVGLWCTALPDRFLYMSDKSGLLGYDAADFTAENGTTFSYNNVHPDYLQAAFEINEKGINYIIENKVAPFDNILLSFDALYRKKDGSYFHFMQQIVLVESDANGYPLLFMSLVSDISHLKRSKTSNCVFVFKERTEIWRYNTGLQKLELIKPPTEQEKQVIRLLGKGLTTKEIADRMFISPHTVDTHRRNLIRKTDCIDTTAVVSYANMTGLI